jgi:hypothetical protein
MKAFKSIYFSYFIIYSFVFSLFNFNAEAQEAKKFVFGIRAGEAIPLGQLVSQNFDNGGYASLGISSSAEGIWYFRPHFGIGFSVASTSFNFEDFAYAQDIVNHSTEMSGLYLKSDNYKVRTYSAGLYYKTSISAKFSMTGKLSGGIFWAKTPHQLYSEKYDSIVIYYLSYEVTSSRDTKAMFQPGLACQYQLFDQVGLSLNTEYTIAATGFGFQTATTTYVKKLTFSYVNAMLGIDFKF